MALVGVLFNATIVLIPIWLGVARYIISESSFQSTSAANTVGLGMILVLLGILYPMWISVQQLAAESAELSTGLFVLFATVSLIGLGGVLFIIREIDPISGKLVAGIPVGITSIGIFVVLLPSIINQSSVGEVELFFNLIGFVASFAVVLNALGGVREILQNNQSEET